MRSLFLKIFLWFWATVVAVSLALVITWSLQPELAVNRWRAATSEAYSLYAQTAAEEMDRYGEVALGNYLARLNANARIRAALLDQNGRVIAGHMPPEAAALVPEAMQSDQPEFDVHRSSAFAAQKAVGPSGRLYVFVAAMPRGPFGGFRRTLRTEVIRWTVSILVSGLICYLLTRYLTRPILRLRTAAGELAVGNLDARATPSLAKRHDELGELVRDFNLMADRIQSLVTSQRQLISDISHELRSPLARLNVALGLARQRAGTEASGPLDRIEWEAERLNEMIGKLLSLARMETASGPPEKAAVNVAEVLTEVADDAEFEAQERGCTVRLSTAPGAENCQVMGSADLLRSAFENVVRNAIRYTASETAVEVKLACSQNQAVITVHDHGPGVPEAELPNLFLPFYRVANARERQSGGTGLGLAITERAVRLHGGTVRATNAPEGGLQVEVRLPGVVVPSPRVPVAVS